MMIDWQSLGADFNYAERVEKHIEICRAFFAIERPSRAYRAETDAERQKRHYWSRKEGVKLTKQLFWTAAPKLISGALIVSTMEEAEAAFLQDAKAPEARRYMGETGKKRVRRKLDYVPLKPRDFIRVRILANGQNGVITAFRYPLRLDGPHSYRVTIDPKVRWKNKFRRWMLASEFEIIDGKELPR